jgi:hypothetical protein
MKKSVALAFVVILVLTSVAFAQTTQPWPPFSDNINSYSGAGANQRRLTIAPFTRELYFGYGYSAPFVNYGSKGPTYRTTNTGSKSAYSATFNLDTNDYSSRGRDPSKISNWDPGVLGYPRIDRSVSLYAYDPTAISLNYDETRSRGTARVTTFGNQYGAGGNNPYPTSQILVQTKNLPPVGENEIYEVWLMDKESEYSITLGLIKNALDPTGSLITVIPRLVDQYDYVLVTREPFPDLNPGPGEIVVMGEINPSRTEIRPSPVGLEHIR